MACYRFKVLPAHILRKSYKESLCWLRVVTHSGVNKRCWLLLLLSSSLLLLMWLVFQNGILRWPDASANEVHRGQIQRCKKNYYFWLWLIKCILLFHRFVIRMFFIIIILTLYGSCFVRSIPFTLKVSHITSNFLSLTCLKLFTHSRFMCAAYVPLRSIRFNLTCLHGLFVVAIEPKAKENLRMADRLSILCYADGVHNVMWYRRGSECDVMSGSRSSECDVRES